MKLRYVKKTTSFRLAKVKEAEVAGRRQTPGQEDEQAALSLEYSTKTDGLEALSFSLVKLHNAQTSVTVSNTPSGHISTPHGNPLTLNHAPANLARKLSDDALFSGMSHLLYILHPSTIN